MAKPILAALACAFVLLPRGARAAAIPTSEHAQNATGFDAPSVSVGTPYHYHLSSSRPSAASPPTSRQQQQPRGGGTTSVGAQDRALHQPPGPDADPEGLTVYDTLADVPTARLLWRARRQAKCYATERLDCWSGYLCGHRCEPVLLAVRSFCRMDESFADGTPRWTRCTKARKFNRCFARVCFRRTGNAPGKRPASYEDPLSVAIVRYSRPPPKHEVLARKNRQSSTQSAIFK